MTIIVIALTFLQLTVSKNKRRKKARKSNRNKGDIEDTFKAYKEGIFTPTMVVRWQRKLSTLVTLESLTWHSVVLFQYQHNNINTI